MKQLFVLLVVCLSFISVGYGQEKLDTSKVIMLICDTSNRFAGDVVLWRYGYMVNQYTLNTWDMPPFRYELTNTWYYDIRKLMLPKSIIVWQTKLLQ